MLVVKTFNSIGVVKNFGGFFKVNGMFLPIQRGFV